MLEGVKSDLQFRSTGQIRRKFLPSASSTEAPTITARMELAFWTAGVPLCWSLSARSFLLENALDNVPTKPDTDNYPRGKGQSSAIVGGWHGTYAFNDASTTNTGLNVVHNLLDLCLDSVLGPQHLTSLNVQEAECVDIA